MDRLLGLVILSFFITAALVVPFINLLYKVKFRRTKELSKGQNNDRPEFDKMHKHKVGTPVGGGLLVIFVTVLLASILPATMGYEVGVRLFCLIFALVGFGTLGLYDDIHKFFKFKQSGRWGLKMRWKFALQWVLGIFIGYLLYSVEGFDNVYVPLLGNFHLGFAYIFYAAFVIVAFSNAFNITDGLDGLAGGLLVICLLGFLVIASSLVDPTLQVFLGIWIGSLFAFLYFNVYPARFWMGDVGALAFGAALGVVALLTAKVLAVVVIGGVFIIELLSSGTQIASKKFLKRKLWPIAPMHLWLQRIGWEEPKIVMRLWLIGAIFAMFGVWLSAIK
ncbi:MAG: phospho-N-acetylmuramoyl-pentapeptide-transferase [bacterium]|nr:phospho-N-acetylmuramoyl-pentapeptide-transferase [bacterium]